MIKRLILLIFLAMFVFLSGCTRDKEIVYSTIYPTLPPLQSPNVLALSECQWSVPSNNETNIIIGLDENNFRCYIENKEIIREQMALYEKFVNEVNKERNEWNKLNKK